MTKKDAIRLQAEVLEALPNAMFRAKLENGHQILATCFGQDADAFYPDTTWRYGNGRNVAL